MLLGLHIVRELNHVDMDFVHYAIYSLSATIGIIIMIAALFNIYTVNYMKSECRKTASGMRISYLYSYLPNTLAFRISFQHEPRSFVYLPQVTPPLKILV